VYVDVTLTRSKVNIEVTGLLNFRQLAKPYMLAAMTAAPFRGFLYWVLIQHHNNNNYYYYHNRFTALCPGTTGVYEPVPEEPFTHPPTILIIIQPLTTSSIYYNP